MILVRHLLDIIRKYAPQNTTKRQTVPYRCLASSTGKKVKWWRLRLDRGWVEGDVMLWPCDHDSFYVKWKTVATRAPGPVRSPRCKSREEYGQSLSDMRWKAKRMKILNRDGHVCTKCPNRRSLPLHVHHLWYCHGNWPWEYPDTALVTLCASCHSDEHPDKPRMD